MSQQQKLQTEVGNAIFYMHQTTGTCASMCACNHMQQIYISTESILLVSSIFSNNEL